MIKTLSKAAIESHSTTELIAVIEKDSDMKVNYAKLQVHEVDQDDPNYFM